MIVENLAFLIYTFTSIFVIVDPISGAVSFISLTGGMTCEEKNRIAKKAVSLACSIALFFAVTGSLILDLFNISVDALRIVGGILLFSIAFDMMHAKISGGGTTGKEISQSEERNDIWIFPIGLPLLTGPGTISTAIVLMGGTDSLMQKLMILASIMFTFVICLYIFLFSRSIHNFIGYNGMLVFTRLMGILLGAIAVDLAATGIINIFNLSI